jgi:hypothetical protein
MKSYKDFKRVDEAAVAPDPFQELDKQIDALFDELKQKLTNPANPKSAAEIGWKNWIALNRHKYEWNSLAEYHAIKEFGEEFHEALTTAGPFDAVVDEFREKMKQMVRTFVASQQKVRKPRTPKPVAPPVDPSAASTVTPTPKVAPTAPIEPAKPAPAPAAKEPETEPEDTPAPVPTPAPATVAKPTVQPPAPAPAKAAEPAESEEDKLMKLGAAIAFAKDMEGDQDPSDEDIQYAMQQPLNVQHHSVMRDAYIKLARDYLQKKAGSNLASSATPTKDQIEQPPTQEEPPAKGPVPAPAGASLHPTREDLMAMTPKQFKDWMEENDPELVGAYEGMKWWTKGMRDEIVGSFITNRDFLSKKTESLQYKVNKYKELLRRDNRPERLLSEAAKLPFNERVNFYKKKLSSHDKSSTI